MEVCYETPRLAEYKYTCAQVGEIALQERVPVLIVDMLINVVEMLERRPLPRQLIYT